MPTSTLLAASDAANDFREREKREQERRANRGLNVTAPAFWDTDPDSWDAFGFGNLEPFGLASVSVRKAHVVDNKTPQGTIDNIPTHLGVEPAQVIVTIRMWTQEHLDSYAKLVAVLMPHDDSTPDPVQCYHPVLLLHNINALYFVLIEPPKPTAVKGVWEASFVGQEWKPQTNKSAVLTFEHVRKEVPAASYGTAIEKTPPSSNNAGP